jgi:hypothetical protein
MGKVIKEEPNNGEALMVSKTNEINKAGKRRFGSSTA